MTTSIKICGLTDANAVQAVIRSKVDYAGFVYFPASPRHVELAQAAKLKALLPDSIASVSVLVDPDDALLEQVQYILQPDYVQLHGKETVQRLEEIRRRFPSLKFIKAIRVNSSDDIAASMAFSGYVHMLMFDAKAPSFVIPSVAEGSNTEKERSLGYARDDKKYLPGGNGLSFDWALLKNRDIPLPWFLSGGLNAENVADAIRQTSTHMVDVSSGVESAPGVKDTALIEAFVKAARSV